MATANRVRTLEALKGVARRTGVRRRHVASLRVAFDRYRLALIPRQKAAPRGRILCLHSVGTPEWGFNDLTPARFERHLASALNDGFRFVAAEEIARTGGAPRDLALTFDDGLRSVAHNVAPVLKSMNIPWTLFVVTGWAGGRYPGDPDLVLGWREIRRLADDGVAIGSHSVTHPQFARIADGDARTELEVSRRAIESNIGVAPTSFAVPVGRRRDWTPAAQAMAAECGYELVYAATEDTRPAGTIGRTFVTGWDGDRLFRAALTGAFDRWEEAL
jgi:peptidoglycan/xylan/chitin deacetylase (PgdA/CDA1 family)